MDLGLTGRTAIITGGSQGIGRAVARSLAGEGTRVVICARREAPAAATVDEIRAAGGEAMAVVCDATDAEAPAIVLEQAQERFGTVSILINNVGLANPRKLAATTDEDWRAGLDINLLSAVRFTQACLPSMTAVRWGRIVNVSSISAKLPDPYHAIYGAAKAALSSFSKTVSVTVAADGVCCNCVLPGITRTEMVETNLASAAAATGRSMDELMARMLQKSPIPVGRIGEPEEVADAIVFLASERARWITGVTLPLDGGTIPTVG